MNKFTFPNGYEVDIVKKKDVLETIDNNIIDKDLALAIITNCEQNCARFIENGIWAGLPFMGNFRIREAKKIIDSKENQELLESAKNNLSQEDYILFRKDLVRDAAIRVKNTKFLRYEASKMVTKNKRIYKNLITYRNSAFANVLMFTFKYFKEVSESKLYIDNE